MIDSSLTGVAERYLKSITIALVFSTVVSALLAILLGILFAARITRPLASLARAAKAVTSGSAEPVVPVRGDDEIADLAASFNEMTAELRRLDAAKKRVIADAAHELRTPVTLIQGTVEGMLDGIFPTDEENLNSVHEETIRLSRLIDTLRELEVIESGELRLANEKVDLREMMRKAVALFAAAASEKQVSIAFERLEIPAPTVDGDSMRLAEVLYNLLSNALKYVPVSGAVRVVEETGDASIARFRVDDSGPGIPPGERELVFERFYRIDKSRSTSSGGRGLGLAIASEIVKAHGGTIIAGQSNLGGASFTVSIPRSRGPRS
jgi:signal transduction histidine kinase